jgi:hypothetical protein
MYQPGFPANWSEFASWAPPHYKTTSGITKEDVVGGISLTFFIHITCGIVRVFRISLFTSHVELAEPKGKPADDHLAHLGKTLYST